LPTLVVNNRQYRGKLEKGAVLKAICSGFEETTDPAVCLSNGKCLLIFSLGRTTEICHVDLFLDLILLIFWTDVETNECLTNNGGCWQDKVANITACKVFFFMKTNYLITSYYRPIVSYVLTMLNICSGYIPWASM
jgi:hypothetical protein